ncbi:MAG: alpha/beta hydrolase [Pseudomonadota bacterium]
MERIPVVADDGVALHAAACGRDDGPALLFLHEFGGDHRSWDAQIAHFARDYRCIVTAARGYPPSDVPDDDAAYGQARANRDALCVLDAAGVARTHVIGLSMGGYTALQLALHHPERCHGVIAAGAGSGALRDTRDAYLAETRATAAQLEGAHRIAAEQIGRGGTRIQLFDKDPLGWAQFVAYLKEHPPRGAARTLRQVQALRPSLYDLEDGLRAVEVPLLLMVGDEDEPCLDVNLWLKRLMPSAQLAILPGSGHAVSLEEPALFNTLASRFLTQVERGTWRPRNPLAKVGTATSLLQIDPEAAAT